MTASERIRAHPRWQLIPVPNDALYLFSEREYRVITQVRTRRFVEAWQETGADDLDAIVGRLVARGMSAAEGYFACEELCARGYVERAETPPTAAELFLAGLAPLADRPRIPSPPRPPAERIAVEILPIGNIPSAPILDAARASGLVPQIINANATIAPSTRPLVVLTDDYLRPKLVPLAQRLHALKRPWLLARPLGTVIWIGPFFARREDVPAGCWQCLAQRLAGNREVESHVARSLGRRLPLAPARGWTVESLALCMGEIATRLAEPADGEATESDTCAHLTTIDCADGSRQVHHLVRRPQCPLCGDGGRKTLSPRPIRLRPTAKRFTADGGHRNRDPEDTWRRYRHHVSPFTGAVTFLARVDDGRSAFAQAAGEGLISTVTGNAQPSDAGQDAPGDLPLPIHNYIAGHNLAMNQPGLAGLKAGLRSKSAGKGMSDAQARASGLAEALERYCGVFTGEEPRRRARFVDFTADDVIDPRTCMLFSARQYAERAAWRARGSSFQYVPDPFDEEAEIDWSPVWSMTAGHFRHLPTSLLYFSHPEGGRFCTGDSNGCAAGNTIEEAILQGFMELVERDAVAVWWYNRVPRPKVDIASFGLDYTQRLAPFLHRHGRDFHVIDITHDFGIPVFAAVTWRTDKPTQDIVFAFGAHFDARIALTRALTEMCQFLPAVLHMPADGSGEYGFPDPDSVRWWKTARMADHPYLSPAADLPARGAGDFPELACDDIADEVRYAQRLVEERGMEMLVLDQTRPDIGLPVVKVIVPGMRHFWARFAPGRLYEVPVELGWLNQSGREEDLNPIAMFI